MKKSAKRSIIVSAVLAIIMCVSLAAGATFALFTSESKVNITVSSGKVNVVATIEDLQTYSGKDLTGIVETDKERIYATDNQTVFVGGKNGTFANGGTATINEKEGTVTLDKMTPGDKVTFKITVTNDSNVTIMYRTALAVEDKGLFSGLTITIDDEELTGLVERTTYKTLEVTDIELPVSITLPSDAGNAYQDTGCDISFTVEAIQGNAFNGVYNVTPDNVQYALDNATDGDTIILGEGNYGTLHFRQSAKSQPFASGSTGADSLQVNGEKITYTYHPGRTDVTYMRTLKNITIVGSDNATVKNIEFMDGNYKYAEDTENSISGNTIYSEQNSHDTRDGDSDPDNRLISFFTLNNLTFKNIKFEGDCAALKLSKTSNDKGLNTCVYRYKIDGLYFDGCSFKASEKSATNSNMLLEIICDGTETIYKNVFINNCTVDANRLMKVDGVENLTITNNTINGAYAHNILLSQASGCAPVTGNVIISNNKSDGSLDRFIRIGDASKMNLVITNNIVTNIYCDDYVYIKVGKTPLSKTVAGNVVTAKDSSKTCTVQID